jgi:hypothetical protein
VYISFLREGSGLQTSEGMRGWVQVEVLADITYVQSCVPGRGLLSGCPNSPALCPSLPLDHQPGWLVVASGPT